MEFLRRELDKEIGSREVGCSGAGVMTQTSGNSQVRPRDKGHM